MQIKSILAVLTLFISCLSLQAQRDSIINKTWIATMGDIFRFSSDSTKPGGVAFRLNYDYYKNDFVVTLNDTSFNIKPLNRYPSTPKELISYNYRYFKDSMLLETNQIKNFPHSLKGSVSKNIKRQPMDPDYNQRLVFYDSTYYFRVRELKSLFIKEPAKTILIDSSGRIQVTYYNLPGNYTSRVGVYKGRITKDQLNTINKLLHLSQFELWETLMRNCRPTDSYLSLNEFIRITYADTVYSKPFMRDCDKRHVYDFHRYILKTVEHMQFSDTSDSYLFLSPHFRDHYKIVYGKPALLGKYKVVNHTRRYLYEIKPEGFYSPSDSISVGYFITDTLIDTSKKMAFALTPPPNEESTKEQYFGLLQTFWAPHEHWEFQPRPSGGVIINPVPPARRKKRFLFFRVKSNPYRKPDRLIKKHRRKNKAATSSDDGF